MPFDFSAYDPMQQEAWLTLPIKGHDPDKPARLKMVYAGTENAQYTAAMNAHAMAVAKAGGSPDASNVALTRKLFPGNVIRGWDNVPGLDDSGEPCAPAFTTPLCVEFLEALPPWIVERIHGFGMAPKVFLAVGEPDESDAEALAGK